MMDKALSNGAPSFAAAMLAHTRDRKQPAAERIVSVTLRSPDAPVLVQTVADPAAKPADFSSAVDLIREAGEAIRISEQRADDLQRQMKGFMDQASEEVRRLDSEIAEKDVLIAKGEERLRAAEARAHDAESWLARLHETIMTEFLPLHAKRSAEN